MTATAKHVTSDITRTPLRITFVIHTPKDPATAVFASVRRRADHFNRHGDAAEIVAPEDFLWLRRVGGRWHILVYAWAVAYYLLRQSPKPDIVVFHSHAGWAFHFVRWMLPSWSQIHTITAFHGLEPLHFSQLTREVQGLTLRFRFMHGIVAPMLIRFSCRRSGAVHCLNSAEMKYLVDHRWVRSEQISLYANGVPSAFFLRRECGAPVRHLLFIGQWLDAKGIRPLISAFETTFRNHPELELVCVGTLLSASEVLADFPPAVRSAVTVVPRTSHEQIQEYLKEAHVFLFPTHFEGFSLALLEAMAAALPIITTPVGAAVDILEHEKSALLVPFNNATAVVTALERLLADSGLAETLGARAQTVAREYEWERVCVAYRHELRTMRTRHTNGSRSSAARPVVSRAE